MHLRYQALRNGDLTGNNHQLDPQPLKLLTLVEPHKCSYLANEKANSVFVDPNNSPSWSQYCHLSRAGFRRSGNHFYRPNCPSCNACKPSRVMVNDFRWSKRFKRILSQNKDLTLEVSQPSLTEDHYRIYERYINIRHMDGDMYPPSIRQYADFLATNTGYTQFIEIRLEEALIGCSVVDIMDDGISAIYTYFEPEESKRSLGTLAVLWQIKYAQKLKLPYVYLGYWIKESRKMMYKNQYQPLEIFEADVWQPAPQIPPS